jgi:hypothetical protein
LKSENIKQTQKNRKVEKKQKELDQMMEKLKEEKRILAQEKQSQQLKFSDAPKKIKVEKKKTSII